MYAALALALLLAGQFTWPETREERRGGNVVTYTRNLNGKEVPVEQTEEVVLEKSEKLEITERTTLNFDANGRPGQPITERRELRREGDIERENITISKRDPNGRTYVAQIEQSTTTKNGNDFTTKTEVQRATPSTQLDVVEMREKRFTRPTPDSSVQTTIYYDRNVNRRMVETRRDVVETRRETDGTTVITESHYALRGNSGMVLVKREVRRAKGGHTDIDVFESNAPGRTPTGEPQLVRQQSIDSAKSGGQTVETMTVRTADSDGRLGPPRPADRRVCSGECP